MRARVLVAVALLPAGLSFSSGAQEPRTAQRDADWPTYRRDLAGTGYSPLRQITPQNNVNSQATPIVVDGVMYFPGRDRVEALEADRQITRQLRDEARSTSGWATPTGRARNHRGVV